MRSFALRSRTRSRVYMEAHINGTQPAVLSGMGVGDLRATRLASGHRFAGDPRRHPPRVLLYTRRSPNATAFVRRPRPPRYGRCDRTDVEKPTWRQAP